MPNIVCVGRDGVSRTFRYTVEKDQFEDTWNFRVFADPLPASGEFFDLAVSAVDETTVRVVAMAHHHKPVYIAKGIPEALLPVVKATLVKDVVSSPTAGEAGVWRTQAATKVWKRLLTSGRAIYDAPTDVYKLVTPETSPTEE